MEPPDRSLQSTALVHEAYLRLAGNPAIALEDEEHLKAAAAQAIHWVLVDHARRRLSARRGAGERPLPLDSVDPARPAADAELVALDDCLRRLELIDRRKYEVVVLRYFGGLTIDETCKALGISPATLKRDWSFARAWLLTNLQESYRGSSAGRRQEPGKAGE